jgi:hypothetical protein
LEAQQLYQAVQQVLASELQDPGVTLAKARWIDKYGTYYLLRLSPQAQGRSTLEVVRNNQLLESRQVMTEEQIGDVLSVLDRDDVADTLVIVKFSPESSDNHREWILDYLDTYNFKVQRIQEESE